jgi:hypothetical protein
LAARYLLFCLDSDTNAARYHIVLLHQTPDVVGRPILMPPKIIFFASPDSSHCWPPDILFFASTPYVVGCPILMSPDFTLFCFIRLLTLLAARHNCRPISSFFAPLDPKRCWQPDTNATRNHTFFASSDSLRCWSPDIIAARYPLFLLHQTPYVVGRPILMPPDIILFCFIRLLTLLAARY